MAKVKTVEAIVKRAEVTKWNTAGAPMIEKAAALTVKNASGETCANEYRKEVKRFIAKVKARCKEITDPQVEIRKKALEAKRSAEALFSGIIEPCEEAVDVVDRKILAYRRKEEERRRKAEEAKQAELDRLDNERQDAELKASRLKTKKARDKAIALADALSDEASDLEEVVIEKKTGNSTVVKRWTYEIVDEMEVPLAYKCTDHQAIRNAVRDGIRSIGGVRIWQEESVGGRYR